MIFVVLGKTAAGKTTFSNFVKRKYGYYVFEIGNYVRSEYEKSNQSLSLLEFANSFNRNGKLSYFVEQAIIESKKIKSDNLMFSGVRTVEELMCIKRIYPLLITVKITCSYENRKERYCKFSKDHVTIDDRNRLESIWAGEDFKNIHIDHEICNDNSIKCFHKKISNLFNVL